jgi:hypothetical protein
MDISASAARICGGKLFLHGVQILLLTRLLSIGNGPFSDGLNGCLDSPFILQTSLLPVV